MSKKYVDSDYTLNIFAKNIEDNTSIRQVAGSGQAIDGRTYANAVSTTDKRDHIIYATASFHDAFGEYGSGYRNSGATRINSHEMNLFGRGAIVSGNTAAVTMHGRATSDAALMSNYAGVMMLDSDGNGGWTPRHHLRVHESLFPTRSNGDRVGYEMMANYSYDRKYGRTVAIGCRSQHSNSWTLGPGNGCVFIFTSNSSGFAHEQTISTASLPSSILNHWGYGNRDADGNYWERTYHRWCSSVRVDGDWMTISGLVHYHDDHEKWGRYPERFASSTGKMADRGVVLFKSSSSGWVYNRFLNGYDLSYPASSDGVYSTAMPMCHDLREGTCIFAGNSGFRTSDSGHGRIKIWKLKDDGETWRDDGFEDLVSLGVSTDVWPRVVDPASGFGFLGQSDNAHNSLTNTYNGFGPFAQGTLPEFRVYKGFGWFGCAVSGSYIVAGARSENIYSSYGSIHGRAPWDNNNGYNYLPNKIYIIKSSSAGWNLQTSFESPNTNHWGPASQDTHGTDEFGLGGVAISGDVIVCRSPRYRTTAVINSSTQQVIVSRIHVYRRTPSTDEWHFDSNIENPFHDNNALLSTVYSGNPVNNGRRAYFGGIPDWSPTGGESGPSHASPKYLYEHSIGLGGLEGDDRSSHLILPFQSLVIAHDPETTDSNIMGPSGIADGAYAPQYGGIYSLSGSNHYRDTDPEFEDVPTNHAPFIKAVNGPMNIRLQKGSSKPYFVDLGDTES